MCSRPREPAVSTGTAALTPVAGRRTSETPEGAQPLFLALAVVLAVTTATGCARRCAPKGGEPEPQAGQVAVAEVDEVKPDQARVDEIENWLYPLPPKQVAAGMFEKWQEEATRKPSSVTYTRVEHDNKTYWVAEAVKGLVFCSRPPRKIAVYAPTHYGAFGRALLAGPLEVGPLDAVVDPDTGVLELRGQTGRALKVEVVLSSNLNTMRPEHSFANSTP